jgi:hypothetical protein
MIKEIIRFHGSNGFAISQIVPGRSYGVSLSLINPANRFYKQHYTQTRIYEAVAATL